MAWRSLFNVPRCWHAVAIGCGLAAIGCNPGAFDELANRAEDAGAEREPDAALGSGGRGGSDDDRDAAADGGGEMPPAGKSGSGGAAGAAGTTAGVGGVAAGSGGVMAGAGGTGGMPPGPAPCTHPTDLAQVTLSTSEVGELAIPSWVDQRTLAASAPVRDRVLLVFSVPNGTGMSAWGTSQGLLASPPRLDEQGPLVSLFDATAVPANRLVSIGSAVPDGDSALVYFLSTTAYLSVDGEGIARLPRNGNRAEVLRAAGALFPPASGTAPASWRPIFGTGAVVVTEGDVDYVYVYGCQPNPNNPDELPNGAHTSPCRIARVPRNDAATGESYRYWNGTTWSADVSQAAVVLDHASTGLSVSYNAYLAKYLAVHSDLNSVVVRWADHPEGPWNMLGRFDTIMATGAFGSTFGAIEVPALRDACQRVTYVSYGSTQTAPTASDPMAVDFASRFVRVELR